LISTIELAILVFIDRSIPHFGAFTLRLAFKTQFPEEADFPAILVEPLPIVVEALRSQTTWDAMLRSLPDISWESAKSYGLL
jgi:hypothetical protein